MPHYKHDHDTEAAEFGEIKKQLESRYDSARMVVEECHPGHGAILILKFPNGRQDRVLTYTHPEDAQLLLTVPFEQYVLVGPYEAVASYSAGTVEVGVQIGIGLLYITLKPIGGSVEPSNPYGTVEIKSPDSRFTITLGSPSAVWSALCWPASQVVRHTIKVSGLSIAHHDQALEVIEKLVLALLFQVDLVTSNRIDVLLHRDIFALRRNDAIRSGRLQFPEAEYDFTPLALYRYGRAAEDTPLVQFLAYYQVLEFYFSAYSQRDAQERVQQVLKDPTFRIERLADINRVLDAVKTSAYESGASERAQLRATIAACLSEDELRAFLCEFAERQDFFSRSKNRDVSTIRIPLDHPSNICDTVADRIYDIRCKIVHTKNASGVNSGGVPFLLPFSREAALLDHDIDLLRFIAQRVLIASSSPMRVV